MSQALLLPRIHASLQLCTADIPPANHPLLLPRNTRFTAGTHSSATWRNRLRTEFLQCFTRQKRGYRLRFVHVLPVLFCPCSSPVSCFQAHRFILVKCTLMGYWRSRGFSASLLEERLLFATQLFPPLPGLQLHRGATQCSL